MIACNRRSGLQHQGLLSSLYTESHIKPISSIGFLTNRILTVMLHDTSSKTPHGVSSQEPAGSLSISTNTKSTKFATFLSRLKGQPNKQAAFTYPSDPISLSEHSSIDSTTNRDVKYKAEEGIDEDDDLRKFYEPIETYEGRHRYDPTAQWTTQEERTLVRRVRVVAYTWSL